MTIQELIREIRRPGRLYAPVLMKGDVKHMEVVKAGFLEDLRGYDPAAKAPWDVLRRDSDALTIDTAE